MKTCNLFGGVMFGVAAVACGGSAYAQTSEGTGPVKAEDGSTNELTEIVVTGARHRDESVQQTPIAITALSAATLERHQIASVADIARMAPNLVINRQLTTAAQVNIFIRGFGNGSNDPAIDPPIALYVDGVYQPQGSGTQFDLFNVEKVEIERGPQGTILGKNAPTGAISVTSRRPTGEFGGAVEFGYERFDHKEAKARIDIPIVKDVLAMNLAGVYKDGGNYIRSTLDNKLLFGGEKVKAGKVGLLFTPSPNFEWLVQASAELSRTPQIGVRDLGYIGRDGPYQGPVVSCTVFGHCSPSIPYTTSAGYRHPTKSDNEFVSSQMTLHLTPVTLTAVTGYKRYHEVNHSDVDGEPEAIIDAIGDPMTYHQFSQEVRLSSAKGGGLDLGGKLDWLIGGFYSKFDYDDTRQYVIFDNLLVSNQRGKNESKALFAHAVLNVTDQFNITVGARQSWDNKKHNYVSFGGTTRFIDDPISFKNFSMEGGLQYKFTSDKMVYARYAEGYRGGGYQGLPASDLQIPYRPETVKSYEIGAKADFFDHHLRTNIAIFQSEYKDLQRTIILTLPPPRSFGNFLTNAANARVRGVELEATATPTDALTIGMSVGYLDPQYKQFIAAILPGQVTDNSNFPFPFSSKWNVKLAPQYVVDLVDGAGTLTFNADATYASSYYTAEVPYPISRVRPLLIVNASAKYTSASGKYSATIYGRNITNKHWLGVTSTTPTAEGGSALFSMGYDAQPIVYGMSVGMKF